ncbi:MAG: class I SAM-dependent methyltransferase [Planctomycetota bacterium]|jgi:SAM-dependent methyltransferase
MTRTFIHQDLSGGRWIPPWLRHQQATRYLWVTSFTNNKRVLEVGCGGGAGCHEILTAGAAEVTGVDVDADGVQHARQRFKSPRLKFDVVQDARLPLQDAAYDVVVALETVEHVENDRSFVEELERVLRPGGELLLSTPNRVVTNPGTSIDDRPVNPLHVREYTKRELGELLAECFDDVEWYGQTFCSRGLPAVLKAIGRIAPLMAVRCRQLLRIALLPLDSPKRHQPRPWIEGREPEVLILKCRKSDQESEGRENNG